MLFTTVRLLLRRQEAIIQVVLETVGLVVAPDVLQDKSNGAREQRA
jgi:hypothetical protein